MTSLDLRGVLCPVKCIFPFWCLRSTATVIYVMWLSDLELAKKTELFMFKFNTDVPSLPRSHKASSFIRLGQSG